MTIEPGSRIGPYELLTLIGEGGMGQVYRARDERLGREVALKLLPADLGENPERARRLLQEAKAAGRLDHPGILAVHDVGSFEGRPYMVTELLEGRPLREQLAGGALPLRKALNLALQLAQGLAAAHEKGIVHRDIKPENLFLGNDGRLKILDFGLAKQTPSQTGTEEMTTPEATAEGLVMGTVGYMAPEQIQGAAVDHRTDLFAFGIVLYEMLSGHRPFLGSGAHDVFHAILKRPAPDLLEANPRLPPSLVQLVERCLEKDPALRYQSTRDLAHALELLQTSGTGALPAQRLPGWARKAWGPWRPYLLGSVLAAAGILLGGWAGLHRAPQRMPSFRQMTFRRGTVYTARFTPGETGIVYSANWDGGERQLFSTLPGTLDSLSLQKPQVDVHGLLTSGELLTIRRPGGGFSPGTLERTPLGPGPSKALLEGISWADSRSDTADTVIIRRQAGHSLIEYPIGHVIYDYAGPLSYPRISPDGQRIAFLEYPDPVTDAGCLVTVDRQGRRIQVTEVWKSIEGLGWRNDRELWFCASQTGNALWLYATDFQHRQRLLCRVPGRLVLHDLASDGRVLAERNSYRSFIYGITAADPRARDLSWLDYSELAQLSADGQRMLFTESGDGGGRGRIAYLRPVDGSAPLRLAEGAGICLAADGSEALILSAQPDHHLERVPVGAGSPRPVPGNGLTGVSWGRFLPGGGAALVLANGPARPHRVYRLDLTSGAAVPFGPEGFRPAGDGLSADGRWLLGTLGDQLTLLPLDGGAAQPQGRLPAGLEPVAWAPEPRTVVLMRAGASAALFRFHLDSAVLRPMRELASPDGAGVLAIAKVCLSADGGTVVFQGHRLLSDLYVIEGLE